MKRLLPVLLACCLLTACGQTAQPEAEMQDPPEAETEPQPPEGVQSLSPVYTDWSKLTPYEAQEALYTYHPAYTADTLQAVSGCGPLLPYAGKLVQDEWGGSHALYGLVTADGQVVTAPVYGSVYCPENMNGVTGPFLLLTRSVLEERHENQWGSWVTGRTEVTAATDGSWVAEGGYCGGDLVSETLLALYGRDGSLTIVDDGGATVCHFSAEVLRSHTGGGGFEWNEPGFNQIYWQNGIGYITYVLNGDYEHPLSCYLDPSSGVIQTAVPEGCPPEVNWDEAYQAADMTGTAYVYGDDFADPATGTLYYRAFTEEQSWEGTYDLLDGTMQPLRAGLAVQYDWNGSTVWNGLLARFDGGWFSYEDLSTGQAVFRYPLSSNQD